MKTIAIIVLALSLSVPRAFSQDDLSSNGDMSVILKTLASGPCVEPEGDLDLDLDQNEFKKNSSSQDMLESADEALEGDSFQMEDINLEGKLSLSEQLRKRSEKLEERNKVMVEKKIEDIRVKQEIALTNKLQDAFGKNLNNLNEDQDLVVQAAPVVPRPIILAHPVVETKIIEAKEESIQDLENTSNLLRSLFKTKRTRKSCNDKRRRMLTINQDNLKLQSRLIDKKQI
jgi:hypothetical protein